MGVRETVAARVSDARDGNAIASKKKQEPAHREYEMLASGKGSKRPVRCVCIFMAYGQAYAFQTRSRPAAKSHRAALWVRSPGSGKGGRVNSGYRHESRGGMPNGSLR
jgi:hypothetical protein